MRIKHDFVTNSSSIGFIVCIPPNIEILYDDIFPLAKKYTLYYADEEQLSYEEIFDEFKEKIENIKSGRKLNFIYVRLYSIVYNMLREFISENRYIITKIDIPRDECSFIQGVKQKELKEFFARNLLQNIEIEVKY